MPLGIIVIRCGSRRSISADAVRRAWGTATKNPFRINRRFWSVLAGQKGMDTFDDKTSERFWVKVDRSGGDHSCWLWTAGKTGDGYGSFRVFKGRGGTTASHRQAYMMTYGFIPPGKVIRHECDNQLCCNPNHLLPGTQADNVSDRVARGRGAIGSRHGRAILDESKVTDILEKIGSGEQQQAVAKEYGVNRSTIRKIKRGESWNTF